MNKEFQNHIPSDEQPIAQKLQSVAEDIKAASSFQTELEAQLKKAHNVRSQSTQSWRTNLIPALGWTILTVCAVVLLNWALRSLLPNQQPATNAAPPSAVTFEADVKMGNICKGQLAVMHGFSVSLTNQDKTGFVSLNEEKDIGELRSFSWSPNGEQLAIVGNTRGSGNLYLLSPARNQLQPILSNSELGYLVGVAWSHDGQKLLTWEIRNNTRLYLMNKDGSGLTGIDLPVPFFETPQFAPGNESILFYGADDSSDGLFKVSIDGSQATMISNLVKNESSFAWSPDGSRLAYIEMTGDSSEVRLVIENLRAEAAPATYSIPPELDFSIQNSSNLSWAPDGKSIVFEFRKNGVPAVYLVDLDGAWLLSESAHAPAISADGRCLAYISNKQVYVLDLATATSSSAITPDILLADLPVWRGADIRLDKLQWGSE